MTDTFHLIDNSQANQTFFCTGTGATSWQVWNKPPNCEFVNILLIGGGAGGQAGASGNASTRSGGSGGGSAAITYVTYPAFALPDTIYIQVGQGGVGGTGSSGQGGQGTLSYVAAYPNSGYTRQDIIIPSGSANAGASTSVTAGAALTGVEIVLSQFALISSTVGQTGGAGGTSATKAPDLVPTGTTLTAGVGGAGCNSVGIPGTSGGIVASLFWPTITGGTSAVGSGATPGNHGYSTRKNFNNANYELPMFFTGGAGGGSSDTNQGAIGGNGAFGCGGGGGGAGSNIGFTSGNGGRGGDGLVIITVS